ncbi:MAG TPA: inositol monophosphatase family protein [Nocardioidaceae bacterium]
MRSNVCFASHSGDLRPEDAVLGEEHGHVGDSERLWILDPITRFFSRRDPNWRVHVTLEIDGVTELAVVTSPALGLRWWATRGGGAFESAWLRNEGEARRLAVSLTPSVDDATIDALDSPARAQLPVGFRPPSSPLPLVEVVRGEIDGFLAERYFKWDHAPWLEEFRITVDRCGTAREQSTVRKKPGARAPSRV